jgi:hypothetical protein
LWDLVLSAAAQEALADRRHQVVGPMAAHRPPEAVGFGAREAGAFHRDLQDLLLVEDDAECLLEDRFQARVDVHHRLSALLAPEVRMHRITLDRSRADDGDLDD